MYTPIVSIIMPVYNVEKYIGVAVSSILQQSFADFELICIEDASCDSSAKMLQEWAAKDERLHIITLEKHLGESRARNIGTAQAQGKFIIHWDAVDWYAPEGLRALVEAAEADGAEAVIGSTSYMSCEEGSLSLLAVSERISALDIRQAGKNLPHFLSYPQAILFDRRRLEELGLSFDEGIEVNPGDCFLAKTMFKLHSVSLVPEKIFEYRLHQNCQSYPRRVPTRRGDSLTIVLCIQKNDKNIYQCLQYLKKQTVESFYVLVLGSFVDENIKKQIEQICADWSHCRFVGVEERGLSHIKNKALALVQTEWLAFIESTACPDENWIMKVFQTLQKNDFEVCSGPCHPRLEDRALPEWLPQEPEQAGDDAGYGRVTDADRMHGANVVFLRDALNNSGGFPEFFAGADWQYHMVEEYVLFQRLLRGGYRLGAVPDLAVDCVMEDERYGLLWQLKARFRSGCFCEFRNPAPETHCKRALWQKRFVAGGKILAKSLPTLLRSAVQFKAMLYDVLQDVFFYEGIVHEKRTKALSQHSVSDKAVGLRFQTKTKRHFGLPWHQQVLHGFEILYAEAQASQALAVADEKFIPEIKPLLEAAVKGLNGDDFKTYLGILHKFISDFDITQRIIKENDTTKWAAVPYAQTLLWLLQGKRWAIIRQALIENKF